jgi:choline dehydrogenase-like flavoprotein
VRGWTDAGEHQELRRIVGASAMAALGDRSDHLPRGKVLGGSSSINAMIFQPSVSQLTACRTTKFSEFSSGDIFDLRRKLLHPVDAWRQSVYP